MHSGVKEFQHLGKILPAWTEFVFPDTGGTQYNCFVFCCHQNPLLHPPDTITPLMA